MATFEEAYPRAFAALEVAGKPQITTANVIQIMRGSFGCPGCTNHFDPDPYWNYEGSWSDNARGDGGSYSGIYGSVTRQPGESDEELVERAHQEASRIAEEYDLPCRNVRR